MKKILIIRFSSIGDIILTTPVVRCLKTQLNAEVHYVTKSSFAFLLKHNPHIDRVHVINDSIAEVLEELKQENFDYVIDLHNNIRSVSLKKKLGCPTGTVKKLNIRKWIFVNLKWNVMPDVHIVDRYLAACSALGVKNDGGGLDYFIAPENEVSIASMLPESHGQGYVACGIGGQHEGKKMPQGKLISLLKKIDRPMVLLGGKEDRPVAEAVVKAVGNRVVSLCGELNMDQSASLVKQARLVMANDTAIMHIGAAFKKNVVSLWGQTVPEFGMYPYLPGEHSLIVEPEATGRPVSKLGNRKQAQHIMLKINEGVIVDHIKKYF